MKFAVLYVIINVISNYGSQIKCDVNYSNPKKPETSKNHFTSQIKITESKVKNTSRAQKKKTTAEESNNSYTLTVLISGTSSVHVYVQTRATNLPVAPQQRRHL